MSTATKLCVLESESIEVLGGIRSATSLGHAPKRGPGLGAVPTWLEGSQMPRYCLAGSMKISFWYPMSAEEGGRAAVVSSFQQAATKWGCVGQSVTGLP